MIFRRVVFAVVLVLGLQGVGWAAQGKNIGAGLVPARNGDGRPQGAPLPEVETYAQLLSAIRKVRAATEKRIEEAVERENVRKAWETGKLIDVHVLHQKRADYGKKVLVRLSEDLGTSESELGFMLQFARAYPISWPARKLSWSHWQALLSINDDQVREKLAEEAERRGWTRDRVREEVRKYKAEVARAGREEEDAGAIHGENSAASLHELPLQAKPGKVGTYRIVKATAGPLAGELVIDLGFSNYLSLEEFSSRRWPQESREGRRGVTLDKQVLAPMRKYGEGISKEDVSFTEGDIVERVGATLVVARDGGGAKARAGTRPAPTYKIKKSNRTQDDGPARDLQISAGRTRAMRIECKYDRYLTDVWVGDVYVNQELVSRGFASVVPDS